jgi:type IV secretion system protein VirB1
MKALAMIAFLLTTLLPAGTAQQNIRMDRKTLRGLAQACAPNVAPDTIEAIASAESALHPYALSVNYPAHSARSLGYKQSNLLLAEQPQTRDQAVKWTRWLLTHGYTVSIGLMQVNSKAALTLRIEPITLFDPCSNLAAGARILAADYRNQTHDLDGLIRSLSLYNSGSTSTGIINGYTQSVIQSAPKP